MQNGLNAGALAKTRRALFIVSALSFYAVAARAEIRPLPDEFWVQSRNEVYCARVKVNEIGGYYKEILLTVSRAAGGGQYKPLWNCEIFPGEVLGGDLSDDGEFFVYVNPVYEEAFDPLVSFYTRDGLWYSLSGGDFGLEEAALAEGQCWLREPYSYGFVPRAGKPPLFKLRTCLDQVIALDLSELAALKEAAQKEMTEARQRIYDFIEGKPPPKPEQDNGMMVVDAYLRMAEAVLFAILPVIVGIKNDQIKPGLIGMGATFGTAFFGGQLLSLVLVPLVAGMFCVGIVYYRFH